MTLRPVSPNRSLALALSCGVLLSSCSAAPSGMGGAFDESEVLRIEDEAELEADGWRVDGSMPGKVLVLPAARLLLDRADSRSMPGLFGLDGSVLVAPERTRESRSFGAASPGGELIVTVAQDRSTKPVRYSVLLHSLREGGGGPALLERTVEMDGMPTAVRVSWDGSLMQVGWGGGRRQYRVDPESLDIELTRLQAEESGKGLSLSPRGVWAIEKETSTKTLRRYLGVVDGEPRLGPALAVEEGGKSVRVVAESLDGRFFVTRGRTGDEVRRLWGVEDGVARDLGVLETDAAIDGDRLIRGIPGTGYVVCTIGSDGPGPTTLLPERSPSLQNVFLDTRPDGSERLVELGREGVIRSHPIRSRIARRVRIGEDLVDWSQPTALPEAGRFADLRPAFTWEVEDGGLRVRIDVANRGNADAFRVRAEVRISAMRGAEDRTVTLHVGRVGAGESAHRSLRIDAPELERSAAVLTLRVQGPPDLPERAIEELWLPLHMADAAEYDARVREVFDASVRVMNESLGRNDSPRLLTIPGAMGFMGGDGEVIYQNPFTMDREVQGINMRVMGVSDMDSLMRHAQMFPYWFIPHEVVHCYGEMVPSWRSEFLANEVQPHLTARLLGDLDCPYSPEFMRAVYDRYVRELRSTVGRAEADHIERFLAGGGAGSAFADEADPLQIFRHRTGAYVYFGARINQNTLVSGETLPGMMQRYWARASGGK